jgi:hypothetical protein
MRPRLRKPNPFSFAVAPEKACLIPSDFTSYHTSNPRDKQKPSNALGGLDLRWGHFIPAICDASHIINLAGSVSLLLEYPSILPPL